MRRRYREEDHTGELNIVPYLDVVVNLVVFALLSMTGLVTLGALNVSASGTQAAARAESPKLLLTVAVGRDGFHVSGAGGVLGGEASPDGARGPTIPLRDGELDYAALSQEMRKVKDRFPDETALILSAEAETPYDVLVRTMDACREVKVETGGRSERRPLFFDVSLAVGG
jgi:biopolymer transport protein ExbD